LEEIQLAAVTLNSDARIVFCNDFLLQLTGWQRDEVLGHDWIELFVPEPQRKETRQFMQTDQPALTPNIRQAEMLTRSGKQRLISWNLTRSWSQEGKLTSITAIGEDITERYRAQEDLRKLSRAVEQSPSVVMIVNRKGKIEYVNPKFCQITGYRPDEVIGKNPSILKSGETTSDEYKVLWDTLLSGGIWRGELHNKKKNGELFWEAAAISPVRDKSGEITHFLAVKEDITERKRLEHEVEKHNRELAKTHALAVVGRMANMIAHDLRNPLSSIKMTLQILGKQKQPHWHEDNHELCQIALEQVRYMEDMLADLLTYSRPDTLKPEWLAIDKLLDAAIGLVQKKIDEYGVELSTCYQPGLPTLYADATKLRQVFSNLIVNAVQSTEKQPSANRQVSVHTRLLLTDDGPRIQVEISDNGVGIDPAQHENLFEPFFTTRAKGSGLGLAIVKRVVEQHQGSVRLQKGDGGGTCAIIVLPTNGIQAKENRPAVTTASNSSNIYPITARSGKN
ncbi:MAG TPA: PAS domain-containing sensor histidine kinase, partial [Gammaproteobacteria bacterium]|nr:PAS domain-containing sensor histidine kinase [Gammaproteobacteria bacterium]